MSSISLASKCLRLGFNYEVLHLIVSKGLNNGTFKAHELMMVMNNDED